MHLFSLIGRHLESVSRTELIFELTLAPSEERLICEFRISNFEFLRIIELSCSGHKLQRLCQGKAQRSQRAKNRKEPFPGTIGRANRNLVAVGLDLLVTDLWVMAGKNGTLIYNNWPPS